MSSALNISLIQINPIVGDLAYNAGHIRKAWDAAPEKADLLVFPELSLCGYTPEDLVRKPAFLDAVETAIAALVDDSRTRKAAILIGAPLRDDGKVYNAAYLIGGGRVIATVRKHALPNYGVFDEVRVFTPGPLPRPVTFNGYQLGIMVCEDMWNPAIAAHLKRKGADILIVINASPWHAGKPGERLTAARACIAATGLPMIYVNQVGGQDEVVFDGASFALSEQGQIILQAEQFVEDRHHTTWNRTPSGRWLCADDKMIPLHEPDAAMYIAAMISLRDYAVKNGFPGLLLGLSGGIDSALAATLAVDAVGADNVHAVMMPSRYTGEESLADAAALAKNLGIHLDTIAIEGAVAAFETALRPHFTAETPGIVHENIQPRARGLILMALSNANGRMVLSTGNKSEIAVGYATLYGDMCGGFNPLKDLYKTQVYALSRWRNRHRPLHALGPLGKVIPDNILTRAPTAELKPGQTDQDTLPPYDVLDAILEGLLEQDLNVADLAAQGHDAALVRRVWKMVDRAEYKRRQAAPGPKITTKAFGRERRYPITNHFGPPDES